jgi:hypothetical protein
MGGEYTLLSIEAIDIHAYTIVEYRLMVIGQNVQQHTRRNTMATWQVVDINTSKILPSSRKVIETFDNLRDAAAMAKTVDSFKVRAQPPVRRKKDDME